MTIREAIEIVSFSMFGDYDFYLSNLFYDERIEEEKEMTEAQKVIDHNKTTIKDLEKHWNRMNNVVPEPVKFIDRPHFITVETDELPF